MDISKKCKEIDSITQKFLAGEKYDFSNLTPSQLENKLPCVYAIFDKLSGETLYVGRTKNLRQRLYNNHLMGPTTNARLKKYLIEDQRDFPQITNLDQAKIYLKENCYFQFVPEYNTRLRGQIEGMLSYVLDVKFIHEEH